MSAAKYFPDWQRAPLADPPPFSWRQWATLVGPGLLMVGSNIGGGEWLLGPLVTAQYGGTVMWLAQVAILMQLFYNLSVMRYALWCGESIFVGFFRTAPGPKFWTFFYLLSDAGAVFPYLSANAAVPLAAVMLGRLPGAQDDALVRPLSYAIFLASFVPLIFGGKIYNALEKVMLAKLVLVLGYLGFLAVSFISWDTWREIVAGCFRLGALPQGDFNWATLAAFTAVAGAGGLTNSAFASYARDKGWGMGAQTGALPSAIGGRTIQLSHTGKVFDITVENQRRWRGWLRHILRDQLALWAPGCVLGMVLPAMISYEFIRGAENISGHAVAAMTAQGIASRHGQVFWYLTLLCGFLIMAPTQAGQLDNFARRWTDVIWIGARRTHSLDGNKVKYVYYGFLAMNAIWGLIALRLTPNPLVLAVITGVVANFALSFSALHTLLVNVKLLPENMRPGWLTRAGLLACSVFYAGISVIAFAQQWPQVLKWLSSR